MTTIEEQKEDITGNTCRLPAWIPPDDDIYDLRRVDWKRSGGRVVDFDDGHVPELFKNSTGASPPPPPPKLVRYDDLLDTHNVFVQVVDGAVDDALLQALYNVTVAQTQPWGTYVTIDQLVRDDDDNNDEHDMLARRIVRTFVEQYRLQQQQQQQLPDNNNDGILRRAHGVAVWALASTVGSSVPYHLDYAEQIRYFTNTIVPPILAGTIQCTAAAEMVGGDYWVNTHGLVHYEQHGYKLCKQQHDASTTRLPPPDLLLPPDDGWHRIPYRHGRMIVQSGHLPHLSTRVESIIPSHLQRVIVGFNMFGHDVGALVQQAPEHSATFRRQVRAAAQRRRPQRQRPPPTWLSWEKLRHHPHLTHLLVQARRQQQRHAILQAQSQLQEDIISLLSTTTNTTENTTAAAAAGSGGWTVRQICDRVLSDHNNNATMTTLDVQIVLARLLRQGRVRSDQNGRAITMPALDDFVVMVVVGST